jgi:hypothetical protein
LQTTRFEISVLDPHTTALDLLRASHTAQVATLTYTLRGTEVYEHGVPVPYLVKEDAGVRLVHSPQWWLGKTAVEVEAGPHAEEQDVKRAASHMKGVETKRKKAEKAGGGKTKKQKEIDHKPEEGFRRQTAGARMRDDFEDEDKSNDEGSDSDGDHEIEADDEESVEEGLDVIPEEDEEE